MAKTKSNSKSPKAKVASGGKKTAKKVATKRRNAAAKGVIKNRKRKPKKVIYSGATHVEQQREMKHEDFPLFLREAYENAGQRINEKQKTKKS